MIKKKKKCSPTRAEKRLERDTIVTDLFFFFFRILRPIGAWKSGAKTKENKKNIAFTSRTRPRTVRAGRVSSEFIMTRDANLMRLRGFFFFFVTSYKKMGSIENCFESYLIEIRNL